jgi:hypothetical protein
MEFLSTGKVVVSNNITIYSKIPNLIEMSSSRVNNDDLPFIFKKVTAKLEYYNQIEFSNARIAFATGNLYSRKISEIQHLIE